MNTQTPNQNLTSRAMLAALPVSQWHAMKTDKEISQEVAVRHNSDSEMGCYQKNLIPKQALQKIQLVSSRAKTEFYKHTLPWNDGGIRVLSAEGFFELSEKMREFKEQFDQAVEEFVQEYPNYLLEAKKRLNGLYRSDEYPDPISLRKKFDFEFSVMPFPAANDFRVELGDIETNRVREQIESGVNKALENAMQDVWKRMRDVLAKMIESLRAYTVTTDGVENSFRNSLVDNVRKLVELLPTLNITNDQVINTFAQRMRDELTQLSGDDLRASASARLAVAEKAEQILREMEDFI
jgi:flagellar biosynthesis/type III secretory pathway protein FliH